MTIPQVDMESRSSNRELTIAPATFRDAMRQLAGGVSVITVGNGEDRSGMTVTSVASLSVDPPAIVVCVNKQSSTWSLMQKYAAFGVNVLAADQQHIADRFSGRGGIKGPGRYAEADWTTRVTGTPLLRNALAVLDCEVEDAISRHSHYLVIGRVRAAQNHRDGAGLVYWQGRYETTGGPESPAVRAWRAK